MLSNGFVLGFGFEGFGIVSDSGFSASDLSILLSNFKFLWRVFTQRSRLTSGQQHATPARDCVGAMSKQRRFHPADSGRTGIGRETRRL